MTKNPTEWFIIMEDSVNSLPTNFLEIVYDLMKKRQAFVYYLDSRNSPSDKMPANYTGCMLYHASIISKVLDECDKGIKDAFINKVEYKYWWKYIDKLFKYLNIRTARYGFINCS